MRKRKTIYICDHCGDIALAEMEYYFRLKAEVYNEQQKSLIDNRCSEIKKYVGKLKVTKNDKL